MTLSDIRALAEKIVAIVLDPSTQNRIGEIESLLSEAMEDKYKDLRAIIKEVKADAYEDAAKMLDAEEWSCPDCHDAMLKEMADKFRQRAKELK